MKFNRKHCSSTSPKISHHTPDVFGVGVGDDQVELRFPGDLPDQENVDGANSNEALHQSPNFKLQEVDHFFGPSSLFENS